MKKIITIIMLLLIMSGACYGAVSEDMSVYVRKDVFEVYMQNISANIEKMVQKLDKLEDSVNKRLDKLDTDVNKVNQVVANLSGRVEGLDKRIDDLRNGIYLWLVAIGLVIAWPKLFEKFQNWGKSAPSITLEDVKRLIEENNVELRKSLQI